MAVGYGRGGYSSGPYSLDTYVPVTSIWTRIDDPAPQTWTAIEGAPPATPNLNLGELPISEEE